MDYLPLFHNLRDRHCLIVGGGGIALRKIRLVESAGAQITVVAREFSTNFLAFCEGKTSITLCQGEYSFSHQEGMQLIIAATSDQQLNQRISEQAQANNIPVNVVDNPALCTVIFPSIVDRSPIQIAISSGGTSPVLTRLLRTRIEGLIPGAYGQLAKLGAQFRQRVKEALPDDSARKAFWEKVFSGSVAERVFARQLERAEQEMEQLLANPDKEESGEVYLVGAGPGDPDLLTFRALRLMQQADVVLYDRLVSKEVLSLVRRDAELIYVGKKEGDHAVTQENINIKLAEYAKQGQRVLRLKGGDPFIFGRGGEEIEHLAEEGIAFQVVPGITAASGCASYAGIPLTHRDYAQSVRFITGHSKDGVLNLAWPELVMPNQTLVFYMGLNGLEEICEQLYQHGLPADTPAALVEKGTSWRQRVFVSDLKNLANTVREANAKAPTLIIIGQVVQLQNKLDWFTPEQNPS